MKSIKSIYLIILTASLVFLFEGCKKDDPAPTPAEQLVGSWKEVSYVSTGCLDPADNESSNCTICETMVATASTLTFPGEPPYPYTATENILTITVGGQTYTATIAISGSTLTFTLQNSPADGGCKSVTTFTKA
jgi:hypothetical protein